MSKLNKVLLAAVVVLAVVLAVLVWKPDVLKVFNMSRYYAVYMTSGDLYFGKMAWWSSHTLSDVRMIQRQQASEKEQPQLSLVKLNDSIWGPAGDLKLNKRNILWITKLSDESQVIKLINSQNTGNAQ